MSQFDNLPDAAQEQVHEDGDKVESVSDQGLEGSGEAGKAADGADDTLGAGDTEGADSFGPTDTETQTDSRDSGDSGDSRESGETGELGGEEDTTDGNTSADDSGGDAENS